MHHGLRGDGRPWRDGKGWERAEGNGQSRVEKMRCPMRRICRNAQDRPRLRSKVRSGPAMTHQLNAASFSLNPIAPLSPLIMAFNCSCAWSMEIAEILLGRFI